MSYNKCIIAGIVEDEVQFSHDGESLLVKLKILREDLKKEEHITVNIYNRSVIKNALTNLEPGDFFMSCDSKLVTINNYKTREIICPHCQEITNITNKGEITELVINDFIYIKKDSLDKEPAGINKVFLMGVLLNDPIARNSMNNLNYVKYKIGVNNKDTNNNLKSFPYIVSFNKEADSAKKYLKKGDLVFVEGAFQERYFKQRTPAICNKCDTDFNAMTTTFTREVISSDVKYLQPNPYGESD